MREVWLNSNRQALFWALIPLAGVALLAGLLALFAETFWIRALACAATALAALAAAIWCWLMARPRLAYSSGELLVYLRAGRPLRVPLEVVECCFLGQRPAQLHGRPFAGTKMAAVVIRLAERAEAWSRREVEPALGQWQDSYITIYGTWCEPLDIARVNRLNERLRAAQQTQLAAASAADDR